MLSSLEIRNFVLIDKLKIKFGQGFNVLTGETGAGKSIIISALELITGEKGSTRAVGVNGDRLLVVGTFDISSSHRIIRERLAEWGIEIASNELIIKREITKDGKSKSFINNTGVRVLELKEIGDLLVDIHGQHEHQSLFNQANHITFYDSYAKTESVLEGYRAAYSKLLRLEKKYNEIIANKNSILKEKSFLSYALDEINSANLELNEDEVIKNDINIMSNSEKIDVALSAVIKDIFGNESGAYTKLMRSITALQTLSMYEPKLGDVASLVEGTTLTLEDIKDVLSDIKQKIKFNPDVLQALNERLFFINSLKKKYGSNIKEILFYAEEAALKLEALDFSEADISNLKNEIEQTRKMASTLASELTNIRLSCKERFVSQIENEMSDLGMSTTRFDVEITQEEDEFGSIEIDGKRYRAASNGIDFLEFIIAPNKQAMFSPLRKIASGGEISRIMLSLKSVLASYDFSDTMVFDEIDVGVGGRIAEVIGEKISNLSKNKQILTVTHLAQIAVYAKTHFKVSKEDGDDIVTSTIEEIHLQARTLEIARMIAGKEITEASIKHAQEMLLSNAVLDNKTFI